MQYTIDAQGKKLGRVASQAANYLMGKNLVTFARNTVADNQVSIINCSKVNLIEKKKNAKEYVTFTGFRGGLNTESLTHLIERKGIEEAFKRAVYRMLPSNSLRMKRMKNLVITK